ncbi:MAG: hypothetical protein NZ551_07710 [Microscillaceae bacterium]|nr:hypothetical protein [Microscillaceae bacterium]MDW8461082.1 hypothetical protein [Cytophagales bacterium]
MELDDLKSVWKHYNEPQIQPSLDETTIKKILQGKTQNIIDKIIQNIILETALLVLLLLGSLFLFTLPLDNILWYANLCYLGLCVASFVFYSLLYRQIQKFHFRVQNIKTELEQLLLILHNYISLYTIVGVALLPPSVLFGFFYGYFKHGGYWQDFSQNIPKTLLIVALLLACMLVGFLFVKWYVKRLYGRYLDTLRTYLQELQEI